MSAASDFIASQIAQATSKTDLRRKVGEVVNALNAFLAALDAQLQHAPIQFASQRPEYPTFVETLPMPDLNTIIDTLEPPGPTGLMAQP